MKKEVEDTLWNLITAKVDAYFGKPEPVITKGTTVRKEINTPNGPVPVYESIEQYTEQTGKRFRLLKEEKERGLTREQAFKERFGN